MPSLALRRTRSRDGGRPHTRSGEGHHILGHARGGSTALGNGVLLCGFHHHVVHDDGWDIDIVIADDGVPEFIPPPTVDPTRTPRRNHRHR